MMTFSYKINDKYMKLDSSGKLLYEPTTEEINAVATIVSGVKSKIDNNPENFPAPAARLPFITYPSQLMTSTNGSAQRGPCPSESLSIAYHGFNQRLRAPSRAYSSQANASTSGSAPRINKYCSYCAAAFICSSISGNYFNQRLRAYWRLIRRRPFV